MCASEASGPGGGAGFLVAAATHLPTLPHAHTRTHALTASPRNCAPYSQVVNVTPRYARLKSADGKEVIGWENIELISDRPLETMLAEFRRLKDEYPDRSVAHREKKPLCTGNTHAHI